MRKGPLALLLSSVFIMSSLGFAQNLRITLPKRSKPTPVQQLNRDGVKAIQHRDYGKAKKLFYKAYLIDPNDPYHWVEVRGHIEDETEEGAREHINDLSHKYESKDYVFANPDQVRVIYKIAPDRVIAR